MNLADLTSIVTAPGPFVTVHVPTESDVEQAADRYALQWKDVVRELTAKGVDDKTLAAIEAARGEHFEGASRFVVTSASDPSVQLALSLDTAPLRPVVDVAPLPHLLPVIDGLSTRVPYVVAVVDREGAEVWASYDGHSVDETDSLDHTGTTTQPTRRGQARRDQRSTENSWAGTHKDAAATIERMARQVGAQLVLIAGENKTVAGVKAELPAELQGKALDIPGTRHEDGSEPLMRQAIADAVSRHAVSNLLDLLGDYAQERGQLKRACDGVEDVVAALRKAQVQTLIVTTGTGQDATLWFGPDASQIGVTAQEVRDLGADDVQQGPLVDVLLRAALATGADVQLVPGELETAPQQGVGAILRYADDL